MKIKRVLKKVDHSRTLIDKINLLKTALLETTNPKEILIIKGRLDYYCDYSNDLICRIKESDESAFNELIQIKDMRNFIYHYAYHIEKYHRFKYSLDDIVSEIKMNIFYHIKNNYRPYGEPHEISLLIMSMRKWIKQKVSEGLRDTYKPKNDDYLNDIRIEDTSYDESELHVRQLVEKHLTPEELEIFELRFFMNFNYEDIAAATGKSRATCQRVYENRIKEKIKNYLGEKKQWE